MPSSKRILTRRYDNTDTLELTTTGALAIRDDGFYLEDGGDSTKKVQFDVSGVTTATTRTITLPDADVSLNGGSGALKAVVATGGVYATPVVLSQAYSNKIILLDTAAGLDFTLPAITASNVGMVFEFRLVTEVTSNNYRWTAQSGDLLAGHAIIFDKDAATGDANALIGQFRPDGSDDLIMTIKGSDDTQGSLVGGKITFEALTATKWFVSAILFGDGSLATPFS